MAELSVLPSFRVIGRALATSEAFGPGQARLFVHMADAQPTRTAKQTWSFKPQNQQEMAGCRGLKLI